MSKNLRKISGKIQLTIIVFAISFLFSCRIYEPYDSLPPGINIISPNNQEIINTKTITFMWEIEEDNFNDAYYIVDDGEKVSVGLSGSASIDFEDGNHKILLVAEDLSSNISRDSILFLIKTVISFVIIDPFVSPDANGAAYNSLKTKAERDAYIQSKLDEDWVNTITPSLNPLWVCGHYAEQLMTNSRDWGEEIRLDDNYFNYYDDRLYNWYKGRNVDSIKYNQGTLADMGKLGLPMGIITLVDTSHYPDYYGHGINWILTGDNITRWEDINCIEPQEDKINVQIGGWNLPSGCDEVTLNYYYSEKIGDRNYFKWVSLVKFKIENGAPILIWENTDPNFLIKKQR